MLSGLSYSWGERSTFSRPTSWAERSHGTALRKNYNLATGSVFLHGAMRLHYVVQAKDFPYLDLHCARFNLLKQLVQRRILELGWSTVVYG